MSESIQGVVSKVSRKNGRGAILFESSDIWYGAFSASQIGSAESGDNVGLTFKVEASRIGQEPLHHPAECFDKRSCLFSRWH